MISRSLPLSCPDIRLRLVTYSCLSFYSSSPPSGSFHLPPSTPLLLLQTSLREGFHLALTAPRLEPGNHLFSGRSVATRRHVHLHQSQTSTIPYHCRPGASGLQVLHRGQEQRLNLRLHFSRFFLHCSRRCLLNKQHWCNPRPDLHSRLACDWNLEHGCLLFSFILLKTIIHLLLGLSSLSGNLLHDFSTSLTDHPFLTVSTVAADV